MRIAFVNTLMDLAEKDEDIFLLTGDLGFGVFEPFMERFPDRFVNCGISEQNMTSIAAGLALEGKKVYTYSIGNFPTLRCLEQIRNDIAYHGLSVTMVTVGGGFAYGPAGITHHATEDLAIMRSIPGMTVYAPADPIEVKACMLDGVSHGGPTYLRLNKAHDPEYHDKGEVHDIRRLQRLRKGDDACIIAVGAIVGEALQAADALSERGVAAAVYSSPCIKPLDEETVRKCASAYSRIVTVEEHVKTGGLGGAVSEVVASMSGSRAEVLAMGLDDTFASIVGSQSYLRKQYGLLASDVVDAVLK